MPKIELDNISGKALHDLSLKVEDKEILLILVGVGLGILYGVRLLTGRALPV